MSSRPPLQGVRILAISQFGAGPFGTTVLADLGAEVIKIEDPGAGGDVARYVPPYAEDGDSLYFQSFNRGKKSVTLDLRSKEGRAVFLDLVRESDAVFNNLRGDLPARMGLTYDALKDVNPRVVCCSLSGFGATGPRAGEPGYDALIQAYAGYMSLTGEPDDPPAKCGVSIIDFAGGYTSALGLMVGLFDAQRTGQGRDVDVSLMDTGIAMLSYFATWVLNSEWRPQRTESSAHQSLVPSQTFPTADGWIVIFCAKEKFYRNLAEAMGRDDLASDDRFATFSDRYRNREALVGELQTEFKRRATSEWLDLLQGSVPCAPVNTVEEALADPQAQARGMVTQVDHARFGVLNEVACPIKTNGVNNHPAPGPALGEHTESVLSEVLGYGTEQIQALRRGGAFGVEPGA